MFPKPVTLQAVFPQTCDSVWGYRSDLSLGCSGLDTWNVSDNLNCEHLFVKASLENKTSSTCSWCWLLSKSKEMIRSGEWNISGKRGLRSPDCEHRGVCGQPDLNVALPLALQCRLAREAERLFSGMKPGPKQLGFSQLTSSVSSSSVMTTGVTQHFSSNQKNKKGK